MITISQLIIPNTQVVTFSNIFQNLYKYKVCIPILYGYAKCCTPEKMKLDFSKQSLVAQNCGKKLGHVQSH